MALTGSQINQIHSALLNSFDQAELEMMVAVELGQRLPQITSADNLSAVVFELIQWAERRGRLLDLIQGASRQNPDSAALRDLVVAAEQRTVASAQSDAGYDKERTQALPLPNQPATGTQQPASAPTAAQSTGITDDRFSNLSVSSSANIPNASADALWSTKLPPWIFGMNDAGEWRSYVESADKKGWVLFYQVIGPDRPADELHNPEIEDWARAGYGVLTRLVYGDLDLKGQGLGSIPQPDEYAEFASRCARFVANTQSCHIWLVGQEMNVQWFWPYDDVVFRKGSREIEPEEYVDCFQQVTTAIKDIQPDGWVIASGVNPNFARKEKLKRRDGLDWFASMIQAMQVRRIRPDGIDIHAYWPPFAPEGANEAQFHPFEAFVQQIPEAWRDLPIFVSEVTPDTDGWPENSDGWMQDVFAHFNRWNHNSRVHKIRSLLPYRWHGPRRVDQRWNLEGRDSYVEDLQQVLRYDYRWQDDPDARYGEPISPVVALERTFRIEEESLSSMQTGQYGVDAILVMAIADGNSILIFPDDSGEQHAVLPSSARESVRELAPPPGQAVALAANGIPKLRHTIVFTVELLSGTDDTFEQGLSSALKLADHLGDVSSIAIPDFSLETAERTSNSGVSVRNRQFAVGVTVATVLTHLQRGSRIERVTHATPDEADDPVYGRYSRSLSSLFVDGGANGWVAAQDTTIVGDYVLIHERTRFRTQPAPDADTARRWLDLINQPILTLLDGDIVDDFVPVRVANEEVGLWSLPKSVYAGELEVQTQLPATLWPGEPVTLHATLRNTGDATFAADGLDALALQIALQHPTEMVEIANFSVPLPEPLDPKQLLKAALDITAPSAAGDYRLEWSLTPVDLSIEPPEITLEVTPKLDFAVISTDAVRSSIEQLLDPDAMSFSARRDGFTRAGNVVEAAPTGELPVFLVQNLLIPSLSDSNWQIGRLALNALYAARGEYKSSDGRGLDAELSDALSDQENLDPVQNLLTRRIGQAERGWLAQIVEQAAPEPNYALEIVSIDLPTTIPTGEISPADVPAAILTLRNSGDADWSSGDVFAVTGRFTSPPPVWDDDLGVLSTSPPARPPVLFVDDECTLAQAVAADNTVTHDVGLMVTNIPPGSYELVWTVASITHEDRMEAASLTQSWTLSEPPRQMGLAVGHELELRVGTAFAPRLTLRNEGETDWRVDDKVSLAVQWQAPTGSATPDPISLSDLVLDRVVSPGNDIALPLAQEVTAPVVAGEYTITWIVAGQGWDAQATAQSKLAVIAQFDAALSVEILAQAWRRQWWPQQTLHTTVSIDNTGAEPWPEQTMQLVYRLQDADGENEVVHDTAISVLAAALPGREDDGNRTTVNFQRALPPTPGDYRLIWHMQRLADGNVAIGLPFEATLSVSALEDASLTMLTDMDADLLAQLPDGFRSHRLSRIGEFLRAEADVQLRKELIRTHLLAALNDASPNVRRTAVDTIYTLRSSQDGLDEMVQERVDNQEIGREEFSDLAKDPRLTQNERNWLDGLLPRQPTIFTDLPPLRVVVPALVAPSFTSPEDLSTLSVEVESATVSLEFDGQHYRSRNLLRDPVFKDKVNQARGKSAREYGQFLFDAIFNLKASNNLESTYNGYVVARRAARRRLRLELTLADEMKAYLWEFMRNRHDQSDQDRPGPPLAVYADAPFYRRYANNRDDQSVDAKPLKILVAISNPINLGDKTGRARSWQAKMTALDRLSVADEIRLLSPGLEALKRGRTDGQAGSEPDNGALVDYEFLHSENGGQPLTREHLTESAEGYHVLHVVAHGLRREGVPYLLLEDEDRKIKEVSADEFAKGLSGESLRLVVLVACQSAYREMAPADRKARSQADGALTDFGQALLNRGIRAVVAMQGILLDEAAKLFAARFYDDLARTGRIDMAMASTRMDLYLDKERGWDWGYPVLFMSTDDGYLFKIDEKRADSAERLNTGQFKAQLHAAEHAADDANEVTYVAAGSGGMASDGVVQDTQTGEEEPLARRQDRDRLGQLTDPVGLDANDLAAYVRRKTGMELPVAVYGQVASALNTGKHVVLTGPPGTGKTTLAHAICHFAHDAARNHAAGVTLTTATADWTTFDTIGGHVPRASGALDFRPGILLDAVAQGRWLVIDEINRAEIDKAFGELFTVLSGQQVDLPYRVGDYPVRIMPPADAGAWDSHADPDGYDYVTPPSWRIIGTMNVYDKSYLFSMSFAFMRRFAFVDVDLPEHQVYNRLIRKWYGDARLNDERSPTAMQQLENALGKLIDRESALMLHRSLGPAIIADMIAYIGDRFNRDNDKRSQVLLRYLGEAFQLYVAPQLDGLDRVGAFMVYAHVHDVFHTLKAFGEEGEIKTDLLRAILTRVELLYPHIHGDEWQQEALNKHSKVERTDRREAGDAQ